MIEDFGHQWGSDVLRIESGGTRSFAALDSDGDGLIGDGDAYSRVQNGHLEIDIDAFLSGTTADFAGDVTVVKWTVELTDQQVDVA